MKKINCIGDFCPIPILKIKATLKKLNPGDTFLVIIDHDCVIDSINDFLGQKRVTYKCNENLEGIWEIYITKIS